MDALTKLQARIKGSRLFISDTRKIRRLYIPFGRNGRGIKTSAWFEVINDNLTPVVKVENDRHPNYYDNEAASLFLSEMRKQFHEIINNCELERKQVPLHARLSDDVVPVHTDSLLHQANALRFCCSMKVTALFADTGTGKSKIAIDLCVSRFEAGQIKKVLVFGPVSTRRNFQREIKKWCKDVPLEWKYVGNESMGASDRIFLETIDWVDSETQIIVDESHMIKTPTAKRSKRIKQCADKTSYKLVMTGTPVTDNVHNFYMQYAVLSELIIGVKNWLKFEEKYLVIGGRNNDEIIGYKNIDHLMGLLEPYTFQVSKDEVLDLPAVNFKEYYCYLSDDQLEYYEQEKMRLLEIIQQDEVRATDIFQVFTRLQQIASGYYVDRFGDVEYLETHKLMLLKNIDLTQKTVFFCKYLFEIDQIVAYLGADNCAVFTGKNAKTRETNLDEFVKGKKLYFVATMQSGGTGLNGLQEVSSQVVFVSNSFSYFQRKQSIGRLDRQGRKTPMVVYDLLTRSGIDSRIMSNLSRKGNLADEIQELLKDRTKLKEYAEKL